MCPDFWFNKYSRLEAKAGEESKWEREVRGPKKENQPAFNWDLSLATTHSPPPPPPPSLPCPMQDTEISTLGRTWQKHKDSLGLSSCGRNVCYLAPCQGQWLSWWDFTLRDPQGCTVDVADCISVLSVSCPPWITCTCPAWEAPMEAVAQREM